MWIERQLKQKIIQRTTARPAILLTGARQTEKNIPASAVVPECRVYLL